MQGRVTTSKPKLAQVPGFVDLDSEVFPEVYMSYVEERKERKLPPLSPELFILWYNVRML